MTLVNNAVKQTLAGLRLVLVLTVLLGVIYPLAVWAVSRAPGLRANAEGSIVTRDGQAVASELIGVDPVPADPAHDPWFHTRPSALASDPLGPGDPSSSLGSNKAADNADYVAVVSGRREAIARREGVAVERVPVDAVTASGSGLDPAISPAYAQLQVGRVARETGLAPDRIRALVAASTTGRGLGFVGEPVVNVVTLNLAVDAAH